MKSYLQQGHRLGFEQLEDRRLMAGNVAVAVRYGALVITGDNQNNDIVISQTGNGQYSITPFAATTINGQATAQTFSGVTGDFNINLKGGADTIQMYQLDYTQLTIPGNLKINLASSTGSFVDLWKTAITGSASVVGGSGGNTVSIDQSQIGAGCKLNLGGGNDEVNFNYSAVAADLTITMGKYSTGQDDVGMARCFVGGNVTIQTGNGNDSVGLMEVSVRNQLQIKTRGGDDIVSLGELTPGGTQPDPYTQTFLNAAVISVDLGAGDDVLRMFDSATDQANYLGNSGVDAVFNDGPSSLSGTFTGFETMPHVVPMEIVPPQVVSIVALV